MHLVYTKYTYHAPQVGWSQSSTIPSQEETPQPVSRDDSRYGHQPHWKLTRKVTDIKSIT